MKNRKLLLIVCLFLALTMSLSGTLAYLTDTDEVVNVMTLGNVKIEQIELQRKENIAYNATLKTGDLVEFQQGQPLYPAYASDSTAYTAAGSAEDCLHWGDYVYTGTAYNGLWNDSKLKGAIDKFVFVKNTGSSSAYYRTWLAFECPQGMEYSPDSTKEFMMNINGSDIFTWHQVGYVTIEEVRYLVMCATYNQELKAGHTAHPSLLQVVMTHNATSEDMALLGPTYEILAFTQAVQTENLPDAKTALNAAFGEVTIQNHPWVDEDGDGDVIPELPTAVVTTAEELAAALEKGGTVILESDIPLTAQLTVTKDVTINLNGHDLNATLTPSLDNQYDRIFYVAGGAKFDIVGDGSVNIPQGVGRWIWCFGGAYPENGIAADGTEINIYGGNWTQTSKDFNASSDPHYCEGMYANRSGTINIYGGTFKFDTVPQYTLNESRNGQIFVYGGTFINFNPSKSAAGDGSYVAKGYKVVSETQENGDVWYTVVPE